MSQRLTCQAPAVDWVYPEDRAEMADGDVVTQEVERLVHDTWWRLPKAVRTIVACRLRSIQLMASENETTETFENGEILLLLNKHEVSTARKAHIISTLAWGFGMAFLEALYVRIPTEGVETAAASEARCKRGAGRSAKVVPLVELFEGQGPDLRQMVSDMAGALRDAWGLTEEEVWR